MASVGYYKKESSTKIFVDRIICGVYEWIPLGYYVFSSNPKKLYLMLKYFLILQVYRILFKIESYVRFKGIKQNICNRNLQVSLSRYHTVCLNLFYQENDWKSNGLVLGVVFDKPMSWRSHVELVSTYYESSCYLKLLSEILKKEVKRAYLSTLPSKTFSDRVENTYFLSLGMVAVIKFIQITHFLFVNVLIVGYTVSND